MSTIANGKPVAFIGENPVYNGKTGTILSSYVSNAGTGPVRYKVRWDGQEDRGLLQDDIEAGYLREIIVNRYCVRDLAPAEGAVVRVYGLVDSASEYEGREGRVVSGSVSADHMYAEVKSIQKPDDSIRLLFSEYEVVSEPEPLAGWERELLAMTTGQNPRPSEEVAIITDLQQQVERLASDLDSARAKIRAYDADADTLGTMLMDEAENRSWCDEYDEFVDNANSRMTTIRLPERQREYEITVTGAAVVSWSHTVTVTAKSEDDAVSMVEEDPSTYFDLDDAAHDSLNYGYGWDSNEVEDVRVS